MRKTCLNLFAILLTCFLSASVHPGAHAEEIAVSRFATEGLKNWESRSFDGSTLYRIVQHDGRTVLEARSKAAASGLARKLKFSPHTYRYLKWSWKISDTVPGGNARSKKGDDYAARIYVIFPGRFFWQTRALNYIWANKLPEGELVANAFTDNAVMLAVESGPARAGQWISEKRDILDDFRRAFGEDPPDAGAIAIMTDTDNTGTEARAWYGEIVISTAP